MMFSSDFHSAKYVCLTDRQTDRQPDITGRFDVVGCGKGFFNLTSGRAAIAAAGDEMGRSR